MDRDPSIVQRLLQTPLPELEKMIVKGNGPVPSSGAKIDLEDHIQMLQDEFTGQSEILLYHALLNVQLRRNIGVVDTVARLRNLWTGYRPFLLVNLDSRWLVSTCDSIVDHFDEPAEKITAMSASLLINTIKLYETERLAHGHWHSPPGLANPCFEWEGRFDLFDGVSAYRIGKGDMIKNLLTRARSIQHYSEFASPIMNELLRRINRSDTIYSRLRAVHANKASLWTI
jgi:hypothetical protein